MIAEQLARVTGERDEWQAEARQLAPRLQHAEAVVGAREGEVEDLRQAYEVRAGLCSLSGAVAHTAYHLARCGNNGSQQLFLELDCHRHGILEGQESDRLRVESHSITTCNGCYRCPWGLLL